MPRFFSHNQKYKKCLLSFKVLLQKMTAKSNEFFNVLPVADTLERLFAHCAPLSRTETLPTAQALDRVLAAPPISPVDLPEFTRSTMDGYAVRAADTFGASASLPAYLALIDAVRMGEAPTQSVNAAQAAPIHTGGMLPNGADAVVMIERTQQIDTGEIEVLAPVAPGENVVQIGEDVARGAPILPVGHTLRPQDIGGLLGVGILSVTVYAKPIVALMGSGDEIVPVEQTPAYGQIRDVNTHTLAAMFRAAGAEVNALGVAKDTFEAIFSMAQTGINGADLLVMSAGSSVSTRDYTRDTLMQLGTPGVLQHGLAVKPGKPALVGVCDGKPAIGLPGNPVSAMLVARQIVLPLLRYLTGQPAPLVGTLRATLTANVPSSTGREDTVPVKLHATPQGWQAQPLFGKSNLIYTLIGADALLSVPLNSNGLKAGAEVEVVPF